MPRRLSEVAGLLGGRLVGEDAVVRGVSVDSREIAPGDLFVALAGEREDGHAFVDAAFRSGAAGALVSRDGGYRGPVIVASDTGRGLLDLAGAERRDRGSTIVGITGSTGKTSVKDLAASVLATRFRVHASPRSFNTEVGVPLTILGSPDDADVVVCEMGSRGPGHIALLAEVTRPRVGVVTNVGPAHLEMFGTLERVADAKAELVTSLGADDVAVLNADDQRVRGFADRTSARVLRFGTSTDAHVRAEDLSLDAHGRPSFALHTPDGSERVELRLTGEHMAQNALAAAAAGVALGLSPGECAAGLKEARLSSWRMEVVETPEGLRIVNDAYNANPASMGAGLRTAAWMARGGRCIAVLGTMAELGDASPTEHERVGELVARLGVQHLITVGDEARMIAVGATHEGVEPGRVTICSNRQEALARLRELARPGDLIFLKASRVVGLERLAAMLTGSAA